MIDEAVQIQGCSAVEWRIDARERVGKDGDERECRRGGGCRIWSCKERYGHEEEMREKHMNAAIRFV